jgi:hypothetical protein
LSSQNRGGWQLTALHSSTQMSPSHTLGGRQLFELQTGAAPGATSSLIETVTSPALITSMRGPAVAVEAMSKVSVAVSGVALLIWIFAMPVPGLTLIWDADTCDRSKKPEELTVKADEVPALTVFGTRG